MAWYYNRETGEFRRPDGTLFVTINRTANSELCYYLGLVPRDGDPTPLPIDEITVDEPTSTVTWPRIQRSWQIVAEEDEPNFALAIQQLMTITGWTQLRAVAFAKWLRRWGSVIRSTNSLVVQAKAFGMIEMPVDNPQKQTVGFWGKVKAVLFMEVF